MIPLHLPPFEGCHPPMTTGMSYFEMVDLVGTSDHLGAGMR